MAKRQKYHKRTSKLKHWSFITINTITALIAAYWGARLIDMNNSLNVAHDIIFALLIGGFVGSLCTVFFEKVLRRRRSFDRYHIVMAFFFTFIISGSTSFVLHVFTLIEPIT